MRSSKFMRDRHSALYRKSSRVLPLGRPQCSAALWESEVVRVGEPPSPLRPCARFGLDLASPVLIFPIVKHQHVFLSKMAGGVGVEREVKNRERARIFAMILLQAKRARGFCPAQTGLAGAGQAIPRNTHPSCQFNRILYGKN
jgi:hypothetical protein